MSKAPEPPRATAVLEEWFGTLGADGRSPPDKRDAWFKKSASFDDSLRERFGADVKEAMAGGLADWENSARGVLALIVLFDQFARNIYRGKKEMYAGDARAQKLSQKLIQTGKDRELPHQFRLFAYMPLMHSERLADQEKCIEALQILASECPPSLAEALKGNLKYARAHRDIVARFGRFPHRNAILGRPTTEEEAEFLQGPGSSF